MLPAALAAFVVLMPLQPGEDQQALRTLLADGKAELVETTRQHWGPDRRRSGTVTDWAASGICRSAAGFTPANERPGSVEIAWDTDQMRITQEGRSAVVYTSGDKDTDVTFTFTFSDATKAAEATLAFRRLRGVCTTQR